MNNQITLFEHFRLLLSFGGREGRGSFWPYAMLVFGIMTSLNMLMMVSMMMSVGSIFDTGMPPIFPNFGLYFTAMGGLGVLLYAAAVVRRLRDSGRSPLWGLMPLPFGALTIAGMVDIFNSPFDGIPPNLTLLQLVMVGQGLYALSIIALIGLLTTRSASAGGRTAKKAVPHYHEE